MDNNDISRNKFERKIYTRDELNLLRSSELSILWPKSLDRSHVNSHGQWDPVKSFDSCKPSDAKRANFYENKSYRNTEKNKDDISLRPERRKWNDGCQVSINKRNGDEIHTDNYRKSYSGAISNSGGGDFEKRTFNRPNNRSLKFRVNDRDNKYNNIKPEKFSKNNSNCEERIEGDKDGHNFSPKLVNNNHRDNEPEWFSNGPDNCDETIELRGITANDTSIVKFKKDSSRNESKAEPDDEKVKEPENLVNTFGNGNSIFIDTCITSPKREGSRFQDIFQKETKNNYLKETKDVENILKAVLAENVSKSDAEKLHNASKPLPNGVLTLEEIERGLTSSPLRIASKSTTLETLTSFEPSQSSFMSNDVSSSIVDNSKVVDWLSNLNVSVKESDMDMKLFYPESQNNFVPMHNHQMPPQQSMPVNYHQFSTNLKHPPGLPLMVNNNCNHPLQQQQQQSFRQYPMLMQQQSVPQQISYQTNQSLQKNNAFFKQMSMPNSTTVLPRNSNMINNPQEMFISDQYDLMIQQQSMHNDCRMGPNILSKILQATNSSNGNHLSPMNHINDCNNHSTMAAINLNSPPGLTVQHMSRAIVKTNNNAQQSTFDYANRQSFLDNAHHIYNYPDKGESSLNGPGQLSHLELFRAAMVSNGANSSGHCPVTVGDHCQSSYFGSAIGGANVHSSSPMSGHNKTMLLNNLFNVKSSSLPPLPQQARYADQIETEDI